MRGAARVLIVALVLVIGRAALAEPTGQALPGLVSFDAMMTGLIERWAIPGASLAVAYRGRLMLARGYGLADRASGAPMQPTTRFRLGSLAKPITAAAIMLLVSQRRLSLDDRAVALLGDAGPRADRVRDPRVREITIRQLLSHTAGFDRDRSRDPMFMPRLAEAAARQGGPLPPPCATLLRDALEAELDFAPGTRYAYSNIGYCILGRIIERVSGVPYEAFVRANVLAATGATGLSLGRTLERAADETAYVDYPGAPLARPVPGIAGDRVPMPYGGFWIEAMDSHGGWIGTPTDYLRFLTAIDGQRGTALLGPEAMRQMLARPAPRGDGPVHYGLGLNVRAVSGGVNWWHGGSLSGAMAFAVRTAEGYAWVAAVNMRPRDTEGFLRDLDRGLWAAARQVRQWPPGDLFARRS